MKHKFVSNAHTWKYQFSFIFYSNHFSSISNVFLCFLSSLFNHQAFLSLSYLTCCFSNTYFSIFILFYLRYLLFPFIQLKLLIFFYDWKTCFDIAKRNIFWNVFFCKNFSLFFKLSIANEVVNGLFEEIRKPLLS